MVINWLTIDYKLDIIKTYDLGISSANQQTFYIEKSKVDPVVLNWADCRNSKNFSVKEAKSSARS